MTEQEQRCGYVAIVGRPNVGKSTLLNRLVGEKISITTPKPQTTRHRILGIQTSDRGQVVYVDTPGIHGGQRKAINRYMNRTASAAMYDVDLILFVIEAEGWRRDDDRVLERLRAVNKPVILVINKVDRLKDKTALLKLIEESSRQYAFQEVVPLSALSGDGVERLDELVPKSLPFSQPLFDADQLTDRSERFLAAEFIREHLTRRLRDEIPYSLTVEIEDFTHEDKLYHVSAVIWVERESQKGIVIGQKGSNLKEVGQRARADMERLLGTQVVLKLWVKTKTGWSDDERALARFGYEG